MLKIRKINLIVITLILFLITQPAQGLTVSMSQMFSTHYGDRMSINWENTEETKFLRKEPYNTDHFNIDIELGENTIGEFHTGLFQNSYSNTSLWSEYRWTSYAIMHKNLSPSNKHQYGIIYGWFYYIGDYDNRVQKFRPMLGGFYNYFIDQEFSIEVNLNPEFATIGWRLYFITNYYK